MIFIVSDISKNSFVKELIKFPKKNILIIFLLLGFGEWFLSDLANFAGGSIGFFLLCFGGYFYLKNDKPKFNEPRDLNGWINLCKEDLEFFNELEEKNNLEKQNINRKERLDLIINRCTKEKICCIGQNNYQLNQSLFRNYFKKDKFDLNFIENLPSYSSSEEVPLSAINSDAILYFLELPLTAKDLLWLEKLPEDMPIWLVALTSMRDDLKNELEELKGQISEKYLNRIINIDITKNKLTVIPFSLRKSFTVFG